MERQADGRTHKHITCSRCRKKFIHAVHDQLKYESRGWKPPKNCYACRTNRKEFKEALVRLRYQCSHLNDLDSDEGVQNLATTAEEVVRLAESNGWFNDVEDLPTNTSFMSKEVEAFLREDKKEDQGDSQE